MRVLHLPRAALLTQNTELSLSFYRSVLGHERSLESSGERINNTPQSKWFLSAQEDASSSRFVCLGPRPVWGDFLVPDGEEMTVCKTLRRRFGWRIQTPIPIGGSGGYYVTLFTESGPLINGNKVRIDCLDLCVVVFCSMPVVF